MAATDNKQPNEPQAKPKSYPHKNDPQRAHYRKSRVYTADSTDSRPRYVLCPDPKCGYPLKETEPYMRSRGYVGDKKYACLWDRSHTGELSQEQFNEIRDAQWGVEE